MEELARQTCIHMKAESQLSDEYGVIGPIRTLKIQNAVFMFVYTVVAMYLYLIIYFQRAAYGAYQMVQ